MPFDFGEPTYLFFSCGGTSWSSVALSQIKCTSSGTWVKCPDFTLSPDPPAACGKLWVLGGSWPILWGNTRSIYLRDEGVEVPLSHALDPHRVSEAFLILWNALLIFTLCAWGCFWPERWLFQICPKVPSDSARDLDLCLQKAQSNRR